MSAHVREPYRDATCNHYCFVDGDYDAACYEDKSIRLYNTGTGIDGEGAVHVCDDGMWYASCIYSWDCADAEVACRELGYTAGAGQ